MPSTFSPALRIELIGSGEQSGVWGNTTNNNLGDLVEQAITGATDLNVTAADVTLTALNGVTDQARSAVLIVTGTAGITRVITIPNANKAYTVKNRSDATVQIKTASGTAFDVPTLSEAYVYCNGLNVITGRVITDGANAITSLASPFNSPAFTGTPTAPTASLGTSTTQIATTAFVQAALQAVYPVGSVYINADVGTDPSTLLGFGTWSAIGAGRVLVGQDVGDPLFDVLGDTGGSKDATLVSHSHTGSGTTGTTSISHTHTFSSSVTTGEAGGHNHTVNDPSHNHIMHGEGSIPGGGFLSNNNSLYSGGGASSFGVTAGVDADLKTGTATTGISLDAVGNHAHSVSVSGTTAATDPSHAHSFSFTTNTQGSSATNANIQPFLTVKMWKRTA
jgi:hypothetical protein